MALGLLGVDTWSDFLGGWGGRQLSQYKGRVPKVSRFVAWLHSLQTKWKTRVWISLLCARTVYSLTSITLVAIINNCQSQSSLYSYSSKWNCISVCFCRSFLKNWNLLSRSKIQTAISDILTATEIYLLISYIKVRKEYRLDFCPHNS